MAADAAAQLLASADRLLTSVAAPAGGQHAGEAVDAGEVCKLPRAISRATLTDVAEPQPEQELHGDAQSQPLEAEPLQHCGEVVRRSADVYTSAAEDAVDVRAADRTVASAHNTTTEPPLTPAGRALVARQLEAAASLSSGVRDPAGSGLPAAVTLCKAHGAMTRLCEFCPHAAPMETSL